MSTSYTTIRLWWNGSRGQAQCDGVLRELFSPPDAVPDLSEIDYAPELQTAEIRRHTYDKRDDMTPPEVEAVRRWLNCFAQSVKRELGM